MLNVIVVPETSDFEFHVSHKNIVWLNASFGKPKLRERSVRYLAPLWIDTGSVNRIFHIESMALKDDNYTIRLGNSFVLPISWDGYGQNRRYEYHTLYEFGMIEIRPGLLMTVPK